MAVAMLALCTAIAQTDTIWEYSPNWHISEWYTSYLGPDDTCIYFNGRSFGALDIWSISYYYDYDVAKEHFSADSIAVKGIAVMVSMNRRNHDLVTDPLFTPGSPKLPEYVMLAKYDSINNNMVVFSDSLRWDTSSPKVMWARLCMDSIDCCWHDVYVYEAFFNKAPVIVDSSFFIVATANSNYFDTDPGHQWHPYEPTLYVGIEGPGNPRHVEMREFVNDFLGWHLQGLYTDGVYHGFYHGGFFPIVDYYNLEARPEEACDSMGTVLGSGRFSSDVPRRITAVPAPGYWFRQWNDGDTTNPRTVFLTQDTLFTAVFRQLGSYRVVAESADHSRGFVTGGGTYRELDTATITATAREGYRFHHWNDSVTDNPRTIVVMQDTAFTAYFEPIQLEGIAAPDGQSPLFTLTPNPAHNSVTVTINSQLPILNSQFSLTLSDAAGRELLNTKVSTHNFQLSLSQYPAGTYFVTLRTPDATSTQRLVIE